LTDEVRRYIISEHRHGRTFKKIAEELGIAPSTISMDRLRHRDVWEKEERLLVQSLQWGRKRILDDIIKKCREWLMELHADRDEYEAEQAAILAANPNPHPEVLLKIIEKGFEMEVVLATHEVRLSMLLSKMLTERYELS